MTAHMRRSVAGLLISSILWLLLRLFLVPIHTTLAMLSYWQAPEPSFNPARWAVRDTMTVAHYPVDRYRSALGDPWSQRACLLIIHGLTPEGKDDPRLVRFAVYLAHAGLYVWVPDIQELRHFRLDPHVTRGLQAFYGEIDRECPHWGLLAISVGAGPALSVLWTTGPYRRLRAVATLGGYADACSLLAVGLGVERVYGWTPDVVRRQLSQEIDRWARAHGWADRTRRQFLADLKAARTRSAARGLCRKAPQDLRTFLARISPLDQLPDRFRVPVFLVHAEADPAIPVQESQHLYQQLRGHGPVSFTRIPLATHVEAGPRMSAVTAFRLAETGVRFFFQLLR